MTLIACKQCGGDGRKWQSKYGGNDPDVWDAGQCQNCEGSGNEPCDNCGEEPAEVERVERGQKFNLCQNCLAEWLADDAA